MSFPLTLFADAGAPTAQLPEANKALAQLGDLAFRAVIGTCCFNANCGKGTTSDQLQSVGSNSHFAKVGRSHGLDKFVVLQNGCIGGVSDGLMATALKAILGAVWQDSKADFNVLARVSLRLGLGVFCTFD